MKIGPIGSYNAIYDYTYDAPENKDDKNLQKMSMKTTLTYTKPEAKDAAGLPFKINDGKLETSEATGTIWFDAQAGRVAESTMVVKLEGNLNVTVSDQPAEVDWSRPRRPTRARRTRTRSTPAPPPRRRSNRRSGNFSTPRRMPGFVCREGWRCAFGLSCGWYPELKADFELEGEPPGEYQGTLFPKLFALVIGPGRKPEVLPWGFQHPTLKKVVFNAKAETVAKNHLFRGR